MIHGIYATTYQTKAYYPGSGNKAFDITYKQETDIVYLLPTRLRAARFSETPQYLADKGRDEVTVRGIKRIRQK